ncbi:MAG: hypothetical protein AB7Q17_00190 [Phycisphaerae bacterium]
MNRDLRELLEGWEFEPGKISVRKIIGRAGREKIQTRVDLGVLQFEPLGRPDGKSPFGCESLLDHHERRLAESAPADQEATFTLSPEDCRELRHEAYLYYQRYLSYFVLEDWDGVERDTLRNLRAMDLCREYAATDADRAALEPQRAYTIMMNTRARVYRALLSEQFGDGLRMLDEAICHIRNLPRPEDDNEPVTVAAQELGILAELRQELVQRMPTDAPERLEWDLHVALESEAYERAAEIRDKLAGQKRLRSAS